jgi:type II secretory pathway component GspD/PulD (secretin)
MIKSPRAWVLVAVAPLAVMVSCRTADNSGSAEPEAKAMTASSPASSPLPASTSSSAAPTSQDQGLREQRADTLVGGMLNKAETALANGDLEAARDWLSHAFEVDPADEQVRALLDRVSAQLGERPASVRDVARRAEDLDNVRRAQARMELERKVAEANQLRDSGDLDNALRALEDAALILRWNPYLVNATEETGLSLTDLQGRIGELRDERDAVERERTMERERRALAEKSEREREERERVENTIERFLNKANDAFYRERYKEAETFCEQVLDLEPAHEEAKGLKRIAADARHSALEQQYRSEFKYHWREVFDKLELDMKPVTEMMTFPSKREWDRIKTRGPIRFSLETESIPAEDQRIWDALESQSIEISFSETALEDAIAFFRVNTGVNFIIDPVVMDSGFDISFDLTLKPMAVKNALDILMNVTEDIDYRVRDGVVYIVSTEEASGGQVLEFYDVRDLTKTISSFPSRDYNLTPSNTFEDFEDIEIEPAPIVIDPDSLSDLIQTNISPDSWEIDPNNTISFISGALVIRQTPEVHRKIDKLLADLRANSGTLINIETRFLELEDRFLEDIGVDFRGLDGQNGSTDAQPIPNVILDDFGVAGSGGVGSPGFPTGIGTGSDAGAFFTEGGDLDLRGRLENLYDLSLGDPSFRNTGGMAIEFTYLDDTLIEAILRAVQKSKMAEIIEAQNLTVFNGQRANITVQDHVSYVKDFEVEIAQGSVIADPVVDVIRNGSILDVRPVVSADRRFVTMEVRPTLMELVEPIPLFRTSLAIGNEVELQLPELQTQRVRTTVTIPDGSTLLLGGMKTLIDTKLESGIPFLRDLPVLSFLFGRKGTERTRTKVMILVRAEIVIPEEAEWLQSP